ncbi:unnamed protein product [Plutella xylostella]|uniref:(diamondback moth) hypothetical protein n=1 Tax=Plutella xylostella TaxID=51655 RepID=A0A8S4G6F5_PLUXY|nr:unnamed protein product [Plutella xylostella]
MGDICRWLKAERVGYPERAVADLTARWSQAKREYELQRSREGKDSAESDSAAAVRAANVVRQRVAACVRALPAPAALHHQPEAALQKIKSSIAELQPAVEAVEKQARAARGDQAARVADKLVAEYQALREQYQDRYELWEQTQSSIEELCGRLQTLERWAEGAAAALHDPAAPSKDLKQRARDIDRQMSSRMKALEEARAAARQYTQPPPAPAPAPAPAGASPAAALQQRLDRLNQRWLLLALRLQGARDRISAQESSALLAEGGAAWAAARRRQLAEVRAVLRAPAPHDGPALQHTLSMLEARAEELVARLADMEVLRKNKQLPRDHAALQRDLEEPKYGLKSKVPCDVTRDVCCELASC